MERPQKLNDKASVQNEVSAINMDESRQKIRKAVSWFYWIAALSLVNSVFNFAQNNQTNFLAGLGLTQLVDGIIIGLYGSYNLTATCINFFIAGIFVFIGILAQRPNRTAFIAGMVAYALDGFLFLVVGQYLPLLFHAFVCYMLFRGLKEIKTYHTMQNPQ